MPSVSTGTSICLLSIHKKILNNSYISHKHQNWWFSSVFLNEISFSKCISCFFLKNLDTHKIYSKHSIGLIFFFLFFFSYLTRFLHIKDPYNYDTYMNRKVVLLSIFVIWSVSATISFVPLNLGLYF